MMTRADKTVSALLALLLLGACQPAPGAPQTLRGDSGGEATNTPSQIAAPQAEHSIGVRQVGGVGEFYDTQNSETFVVRGANYVFVPHEGRFNNLLLSVAVYNPQRTRNDFSTLAAIGYNTVRVFIDQCNAGPNCIGDADNAGLNPRYLDNIADMMAAAREARIYVLFTSNDLPDQGGYSEEANFGSGGDFAGYRNSYYLRPNAITATRRYWRDLLTGLVERNAAFDAVLGWQLLNEQWMFRDQPPLSLTSGIVETTTGSYDMSDQAQKREMVSDGIVHYIAQMKEEILTHDPTALVTMGFFAPEIAAPDWYVETASLLDRSELDFFDFHAYPGALPLRDYAEAFGMVGYDTKPIVLGEYGPFRHTYSDVLVAARAINDWVVESCEYGFDGWLYWTYYPANDEVDDRTWGLTDDNSYLLNLFAPANQPDPCAALEISSGNLAYNKPVRASALLPGEPPANAVDESEATQWGAGAGAVQWIEVDLEQAYSITEIRLLVAQFPEGETVHRVQVRASSSEAYVDVHEFSGVTSDNDWLSFTPDTPLESVRFIRVQTVSSPSWVAWKEVQAFGE